jgi:hypothetical protein
VLLLGELETGKEVVTPSRAKRIATAIGSAAKIT